VETLGDTPDGIFGRAIESNSAMPATKKRDSVILDLVTVRVAD